MGMFIGVVLAFFLVFAPATIVLRSRGPSLKRRAIWALLTILPILVLIVAVTAIAKFGEDAILQEFLLFNGIATTLAYATAWLILVIFKKKFPKNDQTDKSRDRPL